MRAHFFMTLVIAAATAIPAAADTRLVDAVERRDAQAAKALLAQKAGVNAPQPDGATALHWATHWNDAALVEGLVRAGADVNAANELGITSLHLAAADGNAELVRRLLEAGANPNAARPTGETPVMSASRSGNAAAVKHLLAAKADANAAQKSMGQTALMWAASNGHAEVVRALLDGGATLTPSKTGFTPLMFAARNGSIEISRMLLTAGDKIDTSSKDGSTPLLVATVRGHAKLAMFFLEQGAKPDGNLKAAGYTPLHWATSRSEIPFLAGNVDTGNEWMAIDRIPNREDQFALIRALVAKGADIEARTPRANMMALTSFTQRIHKGATPFLGAAWAGDHEVMRLLMSLGADPKKRDEDENQHTALMLASGMVGSQGINIDDAVRMTEADRVEAVKLIMDAGVEIEAQDGWGYRAMHYAAGAGFHKVITELLARGADINPLSKERIRGDLSGGVWLQQPQSPAGVAESYFTGAVFQRPETLEFMKKLGAKSIGATFLANYGEQVGLSPEQQKARAELLERLKAEQKQALLDQQEQQQ